MKNYLSMIALSLLAACGGGGDDAPVPTVPQGSVAGFAVEGVLVNSSVNVYDFSTGEKGALLGSATTDQNGAYTVQLQAESRPILIEVTRGYYNEEAGAGFQVNLASQKLSALMQYKTGASATASVTSFTNLAAALAAFQIKSGSTVEAAINGANNRVSAITGFDIISTRPAVITESANASASLTPELRYGFISAAISAWALKNSPSAQLAHSAPYTSIDFSQLVYKDVAADGLLDGKGVDSAGGSAELSFGVVPLTSETYRAGLAAAMLQVAASSRNKTGITGDNLLVYAKAYSASTDAMFNNITPINIDVPAVKVTSPGDGNVLNRSIGVTATAQAVLGVKTVELLIDGAVISAASNPDSPSVQFDSAKFTDGAHVIEMRATDFGGQVSTSSVPVVFANVAPSISITEPAAGAKVSGEINVIASASSAAGLSKVELLVDGAVIGNAASLQAPVIKLKTSDYSDGEHVIAVRTTDVGNQVVISTVSVTFMNVAPTVKVSSPVNNSWVSRTINLAGTVEYAGKVNTVEFLFDGKVIAAASSLAAPTTEINTTLYADGVHTLSIRATDAEGQVSTTNAAINIDNTAPTATAVVPYDCCVGGALLIHGSVKEEGSGIASIRDVNTGTVTTPDASGAWTLQGLSGNPYADVIEIRDNAGNCSKYVGNVPRNGTWTLLQTGYAC